MYSGSFPVVKSDLELITETFDRQFERLDALLQAGYIEEETYRQLTLALTNRLNIVAVEEVLIDEDVDTQANPTSALAGGIQDE